MQFTLFLWMYIIIIMHKTLNTIALDDHVELPGAGSIHVPLGNKVALIVKSPKFPLEVS